MNVGVAITDRAWAGLVIETAARATESVELREILGDDAFVLVLRPDEPALEAIRKIVRSRSSCLLTFMRAGAAPALAPLLTIATSLTSLRRIVVLHDASFDAESVLPTRGILLMRDCEEVRLALAALVGREMRAAIGVLGCSALGGENAEGRVMLGGGSDLAHASGEQQRSTRPGGSKGEMATDRPDRWDQLPRHGGAGAAREPGDLLQKEICHAFRHDVHAP